MICYLKTASNSPIEKKHKSLVRFTQFLGYYGLNVKHSENVSVLFQLSRHFELEDEHQDSVPILLLMRLSLVKAGHLDLSISTLTKHVRVGNTGFEIRKKVLSEAKDEARKINAN